MGKNVFHETSPWCQKCWGLLGGVPRRLAGQETQVGVGIWTWRGVPISSTQEAECSAYRRFWPDFKGRSPRLPYLSTSSAFTHPLFVVKFSFTPLSLLSYTGLWTTAGPFFWLCVFLTLVYLLKKKNVLFYTPKPHTLLLKGVGSGCSPPKSQ